MEKTKKIILALGLVIGLSSFASAQTTGEKQRAVALAKEATRDCVSRPDLSGLQLTYLATETEICDFAPGPIGNAAIFGYQVDVYAEGHCPGNVRELCDPLYLHVATVFVSCGNAVVSEVICH